MTPLLGSLCGGWVAKEQSEVDEADGKDGFGTFYVLAVVDKRGEGLVQAVEELQKVGVRLKLAG